MKKILKIAAALLVYAVISFIIMYFVKQSGSYPSGEDTMFHVYRSDLLYQAIKTGNFWPLYEPYWYNGVELMRYWAPLPVYFMAFCQWIAGGYLFDGYLLFVGLCFFLSAVGWLAVGVSRNRIGIGVFLGILWFFMPNNLYALFLEGNLPRTVCMIFLPLFLHYVYSYMQEGKWRALPKLMLLSLLTVLCDLGYSSMIFIGILVFLICYCMLNHGLRRAIHVLLGMALTFTIPGIWVVPSLFGGITSTGSSQSFFQSAWLSLNPLERFSSGFTYFYFGLAAFAVGVFGCLFSKKRTMPGFIAAVLIFFGTTTTAYSVLKNFPGSQYLWMLRFISIALCLILLHLFLWESLKKPILVFLCMLLVLDVLPSLKLIYGDYSGKSAEDRLDTFSEMTLIETAKEITTQRMALLDLLTLTAEGAYAVSGYKETTFSSFGAGWQGAATSSNIVQLNQALTDGSYVYMFDRCLEMGNDTVLVAISCMKEKGLDSAFMDAAAEKVGYKLVKHNEAYRLYHYDVTGTFGVISEYRALAIGDSAKTISLLYPGLEEAMSSNLNDYTYEELKNYELLCLSGFTYTNKMAAEQMLLKLSEAGVKIVVLADGIPIDIHTGKQEFLGVGCYSIQFNNGYPILDTVIGRLDCNLFPSGLTNWKTVYLEGLTECYGSLKSLENELQFYGTVQNDNLIFVGLNLHYFLVKTGDLQVDKLLSLAFDSIIDDIPKRKIVPLQITYGSDEIVIQSEENAVNTTLSYHDIFNSEQEIYSKNQLTYVNSGTTVISMEYPHFYQGLAVTLISLLAAAVLLKLARDYLVYEASELAKKRSRIRE